MPSAAPVLAIGADGAPDGWLAACLRADHLDRDRATTWDTELVLASSIDDLVALRGDGEAAVAIDVPIGLPETVDYRPCDIEARRRLKSATKSRDRRSSVFAPPARYMLQAAGDYAAIRQLVQQRRETEPGAKSLSAQAAGITPKIREVDTWVRVHSDSEQWMWECHPELSFSALNDGGPCEPKSSAAGVIQRLQLLRREFPDMEARMSYAPWLSKVVGLSDILDAYAALTTAIACAREEQEELGEEDRDSEGVPMRMAM